MKSDKLNILRIEPKKLLKKNKEQCNELNKVIKQSRYYIYEF